MIDIDDNHVIIIQYRNGVTASYSQTFNASESRRGGCFIGTDGTMELKYYGDIKERHGNQLGTSQIDLTYRYRPPLDKKQEAFDWLGNPHFNGTEYMITNFLDATYGKVKPAATIEDGFLSAKMCAAAQKSIEERRVIDLDAF